MHHKLHHHHFQTHQSTENQYQYQASRRKRLHPFVQPAKKIKQQHTSNKTVFISDSIFKFLIEDKVTLQYILQNDHERNVRLFRCHSTTPVVSAAIDNLSTMPVSGTATMVATFGTVDLTHINRADFDPAEVAQTVSDTVIQLSRFATEHKQTFLYLLPGYIAGLTSAQHQTFTTKMETTLKSHQISYMKISDIMTQSSTPHHTTIDDIVQNVTHDGIHLTFDTGREVLKHVLSHFNHSCTLPTPVISKEYYVAQKHQKTGCYRCGKHQHNKYSCPHETVSCNWCESNAHTEKICPVKLLPCSHCAQNGHYRGHKTDCPLWNSMSAIVTFKICHLMTRT